MLTVVATPEEAPSPAQPQVPAAIIFQKISLCTSPTTGLHVVFWLSSRTWRRLLGMRFVYGMLIAATLLFISPLHCDTQTLPGARADFKTRCSAPGVVRCFGFDSEDEVKPHLMPAGDAVYRGEVDSQTKVSGNGSLRFTIPTHSSANTSGSFSLEFADDLSVQFGEGQEFYVQWRQRFSPEMLSTRYEGGNGWKQAVIGEGSRPGHTAYTCTDIQIVLEDTYQVGAPRMYHSCGKKDGQFEPFQVYSPRDQGYLIQNAVGCVHFRVVSPPCFMYKPNQWMTFQIHVKIGTWYHNDKKYRHDSTVQLWAADEGKPSKLLIDFSPARGTGYDLVNFDPGAKYGKVWLLPYNTNKDASQDHPTAYTWYDDLIVSRNKIADPD